VGTVAQEEANNKKNSAAAINNDLISKGLLLIGFSRETFFRCQLAGSILARTLRQCIISQYARFLEAVRCPMPCINIRLMNRKPQRVNQSFGKEIR